MPSLIEIGWVVLKKKSLRRWWWQQQWQTDIKWTNFDEKGYLNLQFRCAKKVFLHQYILDHFHIIQWICSLFLYHYGISHSIEWCDTSFLLQAGKDIVISQFQEKETQCLNISIHQLSPSSSKSQVLVPGKKAINIIRYCAPYARRHKQCCMVTIWIISN